MADPDFSKMSTEELLAIASGKQPTKLRINVIDEIDKSLQVPTKIERLGRGMMDLYQGGEQKYLNWTDPAAAEKYTKDVNADIGLYERGRTQGAKMEGKDSPGFDWLRLGGNITTPLSLLPGGGASVPVRLGLGALAGLGRGPKAGSLRFCGT